EKPDDEADQPRDGDRVARAPGGRLLRWAPVDDPGKLDLPPQCQQLVCLRPFLFQRSSLLLRREEQSGESQALRAGCTLELGLRLVDGAVDCLELPVVRGELVLECLPLEPGVTTDLVDNAVGDGDRRGGDLASPTPLPGDRVELVRRRPRRAASDRTRRDSGPKLSRRHAAFPRDGLDGLLPAGDSGDGVWIRRDALERRAGIRAVRGADVDRGLRLVHLLAADGEEVAEDDADEEPEERQPPASDERIEVAAEV